MSDLSDRYRKLSADFTRRVEAVPDGAWDRPSPCDGWVARDVVRHLVDWMRAFVRDGWGVARPVIPSVDTDPVGAWVALRDALQRALDDPAVAARRRSDPHLGDVSFEAAFARAGLPDVLVHTWDLARATGLDEKLDAGEVALVVAGIGSYDDTPMRTSGHYGPAVPVADGATDQDRLLAFMGRRP